MEQDQQVPKIKPSDEEIALRQQQLRRQAQQRLAKAGVAQKAAQNSQMVPPAQPSYQTAPAPAASQSSNSVAIIALVAALLGLGGAGYMYTELQRSGMALTSAETRLAEQGAQIAVLNDKLSVSGENANLSVDALKVLLREQDKEIRKLWDLANKKNRADIDKNSAQITKVNASLKSVGDISGLRNSVSAVQSTNASLQKQIRELQSAVDAMPAQTELAIAQNKESIDMLDGSVSSLRQTVDKMRSTGGYGDLADMKLELEDIQIRLDRMQNAMTGVAQ